MTTNVTGQVSKSAADVYEEFFVPALFQQWAELVSQEANLKAGDSALDVACGTGVLTRAALKRVLPNGKASGLDLNEGMLATAKRVEPGINWHLGAAESLPFEDAQYDAVISQFGLMFFSDQAGGLAEMWRVLKVNGQLTVAVWDSLENTPGYAAATQLLKRLFGDKVANELRGPYSLGDTDELAKLFASAGIENATICTKHGLTRYPSIDDWMHMDVKGWTIGEMISDDQYAQLVGEAHKDLSQFVQENGEVVFASPAHIITAIKE